MTTGVERLATGEWLTRRRLTIGATVLLIVEIGLFAFFIAGTHGWIVPLQHPTTTDFVSFYAAGGLANAGTAFLAYDHTAHFAAEEAVTAVGIEYQYFNYPPVYLLLCTILARLPYLVAFVGFEAATLLAYLAVARRILDDYGGTALVVLLAFPLVFWNVGLGQNAFLTAALFGLGTLFVDRRPVVAGLCFGALCYKPHFALLVPLALAAGGHWRSFVAATAAAATLILLSLLLFGWQTWQAFFATAGASHAMYESGRILFIGFVSPFGVMRLAGAGVALSYAVQAVFTLVAAAAVVVAWRRRLSLPTRAAVLVAATLVAVPLALIYDLMLATIAACWLLRRADIEAGTGWERSILAVLFLLLFNSRYLPVAPLAAVVLFALAWHRARREMTAPGPVNEDRLSRARPPRSPAPAP